MGYFLTTLGGAGQHVVGVGDGFRRSCMHGTCGKGHHLTMVVVEDGDLFAEG